MIKLIEIKPAEQINNWNIIQVTKETPVGERTYNKLMIDTDGDKSFYMSLLSEVIDPETEIEHIAAPKVENKFVTYSKLTDTSIHIKKTRDNIMVLKKRVERVLEDDSTFIGFFVEEGEKILGVSDETDSHIVFKKVSNNYMILVLNSLVIENKKDLGKSKIKIYTSKGDKIYSTIIDIVEPSVTYEEIEAKVSKKNMKSQMNVTDSKAFIIGLEKNREEIDKLALDKFIKFTNKFSRISSYDIFEKPSDIIEKEYVPQIVNRFDTYIILYKIGDEKVKEYLEKVLENKATNNKILIIE